MSQADDGSSQFAKSRSVVLRNAIWLFASLVSVIVLSVTASYAPQITKRLILFYGIYGGACGFVLSWLAAEIHPCKGAWLIYCGFILAVLGAVNLGWISFRSFEKSSKELGEQHPDQIQAIEMFQKLSTDPTDQA